MKLCLEGAKPVVIAHSFKSKRKICPYLKGKFQVVFWLVFAEVNFSWRQEIVNSF